MQTIKPRARPVRITPDAECNFWRIHGLNHDIICTNLDEGVEWWHSLVVEDQTDRGCLE